MLNSIINPTLLCHFILFLIFNDYLKGIYSSSIIDDQLNLMIWLLGNKFKEIISVDYSSKGNHTGQLESKTV